MAWVRGWPRTRVSEGDSDRRVVGVFGNGLAVNTKRTERSWVARMADRFVMIEASEARLFYFGRRWMDDWQHASARMRWNASYAFSTTHGHFAWRTTAGRYYGEFYWPSRDKDIRQWVASCEPCQRVQRHYTIADLRPIVQFRPMDMTGMDYVGPITPACDVTGTKYICLCVDYYSRFLFARGFAQHRELETMDFLLNNITPVAGWPKTLYTDNRSHFVGHRVTELLKSFGVLHFTAPISHPSSVGLIERYVQMFMGRIRLRCVAAGSTRGWGLYVRDATIDINTRCVRIHDFTPAEILLEYNPVTSRHPSTAPARDRLLESVGIDPAVVLGVDREAVEEHVLRRDDRGVAAGKERARAQAKAEEMRTATASGRRWPKPGDLVLLRDLQLVKHHGRRLDPRWSVSRIVVSLSLFGFSCNVR